MEVLQSPLKTLILPFKNDLFKFEPLFGNFEKINRNFIHSTQHLLIAVVFKNACDRRVCKVCNYPINAHKMHTKILSTWISSHII